MDSMDYAVGCMVQHLIFSPFVCILATQKWAKLTICCCYSCYRYRREEFSGLFGKKNHFYVKNS